MSQVVSVIKSAHQILRVGLVATAILAALLCTHTSVNAQDALQLSIPPVESAETIVAESLPQTTTTTPGYWIVSSHASPQHFDESAPVFCPSVTRYDHCTGFRRSSMQELMQSILPGVPVSVFCHGSFVSWEDVLNESCETWKWVHQACPDQPVQMVYFSWPSDRPIIVPIIQLDVARLGHRAGRNGFYLANFVQQLPSECPVCLVGHSHGTRVVASALHLIGGGAVEGYVLRPGPYPQHRLRAVFAASAIDHDWMNPGERYDRALCSVECLLNLRNKCDPALLIYPLRHPFAGRALGAMGFTRRDRRDLGSAGQKIQTLDLTSEIGHGHYWPNYFQRPWLARAIRNYLFF